ncbi:mannan endo-1,4-beta-mannosidase [Actinocrispum wychmicini]|uniref:Mannan endo-1,4-beta-mannosidase n=2 Tax=Actinocrispum wychmicini TaxID=1213861 RepID=A0A4R2JX60_9PSEU|nr:mannan endo-1,4-beta-mannosidase [Actinocrispum wychmicini]
MVAMSDKLGRRRFIGAAAGAIALGTAGGIALGQQRWFADPDDRADQVAKPVTADQRASADAQAVLKWFRQLPNRKSRRVVSGQQLDDISAASFDEFVEKLAARTRKYPAMVGVTVQDAWTRSDTRFLVDHWKRGGLISIDIHPTNPWNPAGGANSAWVQNAKSAKPDLRALLATSDPSTQRTTWRGQLERLGDLVEDLGSAGAVVLLRPLHESNGSWFWWGQDMASRKTSARDLYRDIFYYVTETRRLHNVLFVYSPGASWDGPAMEYYPGSDFVDMVCPSRYDDDMLMLGERGGESANDDYKDILTAGKPVAFGECGPSSKLDGSWDARTIIDRIRSTYPQMTYFNVWHGWQDHIMELARLRHTEELMNDPWVITRETVDWRPKVPPTTGTTPPPTVPPRPSTGHSAVQPHVTR